MSRETGLSTPVKYFTDCSKAVLLLWIICVIYALTSRTVLAYKTDFCIFICLQEPILDGMVIFCFETREVYICLVKSL